MDSTGGDVGYHDVDTYQKCQNKCASRNTCGGFSFDPIGECFLKQENISETFNSNGDVSGIRCDLSPHCKNKCQVIPKLFNTLVKL